MEEVANLEARATLKYARISARKVKIVADLIRGKDVNEAVHNAVILEEIAKMAALSEIINSELKEAPQELQDKHYFRKHGESAYYGQKIK